MFLNPIRVLLDGASGFFLTVRNTGGSFLRDSRISIHLSRNVANIEFSLTGNSRTASLKI
jgi:hypothetical protein